MLKNWIKQLFTPKEKRPFEGDAFYVPEQVEKRRRKQMRLETEQSKRTEDNPMLDILNPLSPLSPFNPAYSIPMYDPPPVYSDPTPVDNSCSVDYSPSYDSGPSSCDVGSSSSGE